MKLTGLGAPLLFPLMLILPLALVSCSVGRHLMPQSDIESFEVGTKDFDKRILIASRDSDFKVEVARRLGEALIDRPVYVKFIGIDALGGVDASSYDAVIVMTTCLAWGLDSATESFLKKNRDHGHIVVLITSGAGDWKPDMDEWDFDAVTSASVMEDAESVAKTLLEKIGAVLDGQA
jgi:hypothetical protein